MDTPSIWQSRKFWIMVIDIVVSMATYFTGKYLSPESTKDILFIIGSLQPIVLLVVGSIAVQNVTALKAKSSVDQAKAYANAADAVFQPSTGGPNVECGSELATDPGKPL